jgi:hypothetical protein
MRYSVTHYANEPVMADAAERMRAMRERHRAKGRRELRLVVPDAHVRAVLRRLAKQVASFDQSAESSVLGNGSISAVASEAEASIVSRPI